MAVPPPRKVETQRLTLYFIKGDASLSPGAIKKLQALPKSWGLGGTWTLSCPSNPDTPPKLRERRFRAIRTQLQKQGVPKMEAKLLPEEAKGKYDAVHIEKTEAKTPGSNTSPQDQKTPKTSDARLR